MSNNIRYPGRYGFKNRGNLKGASDSFIIEYFKAIMAYYRKSYLILQMDEHEAAEGYDTCLEAACETFRTFRGADKGPRRPTITLKNAFEDKTYLLPGYDLLNARLIQGALTHAGVKALVIEQTPFQQQGYGLPVIAAGLCHGVARNILNMNCFLSCILRKRIFLISRAYWIVLIKILRI